VTCLKQPFYSSNNNNNKRRKLTNTEPQVIYETKFFYL
jgi:hypothetical protein